MQYPTAETKFLPTKLLLPLFLTSRNRIRKNRFWEVRYYIGKKAKSYASCIKSRNEDEKDEFDVIDDGAKVVKIHPSHLKKGHKSSRDKSWKLAPNRYNVPVEVSSSRKGMKGAFWFLRKTPVIEKASRDRTLTAFYDIPRESDNYQTRCYCHKGKFLTDPRRRRPSSRFMISNIFTCWRNPRDPDPAKYFVDIFTRQMFPKIKEKPPVPYKFLRYSCVPESKLNFTNKSFNPGPGRYELLDDEYSLLVALKIQYLKILQFRRIPHSQFTIDKLRKQSLRHIFGFGFTRLFRGPPLRPPVVVSQKKARKIDREINLFHSFEYIRNITNPNRILLSIRNSELKRKPITVRYNCVMKVIIRRHLRNNKKIAFNSGMPRFPDSDMPTAIKMAKPPPLVDYPVMRIHPSEIKSKLHALPQRLWGVVKENRIRPFKFQPYPPVKLLLDENEIHTESLENMEMYPRQLNPMDYFKEEFKNKKI